MTPTLGEIKTAVATYYQIKPEDLTGPSRKRIFTHPRQVGFHIARRVTKCTTPQIGRAFGDRDHTTVMHGLSAIKDRMTAQVSREVEAIEKALQDKIEAEMGGVFRTRRSKWIAAVPFRHRGQG